MGRELCVGGTYRHFKGGCYEVLTTARHSETEEELVIYRALYGEGAVWARPLADFLGEVTRDGTTRQRFEKIDK